MIMAYARTPRNTRSTTGRPGQRGPGGQRGGAGQIRKKRTCRFCDNKEDFIDYKAEKKLQRFISEQGRIIPKRITGTCARHQRMLVVAIKRARHLALLPFVSDAVK
jgi:small subunit ribosomal protein S18